MHRRGGRPGGRRRGGAVRHRSGPGRLSGQAGAVPGQAPDQANQAAYQAQKRAYHHELARWAAGQPWPERYWGDRYVVTDWGVVHLHDPGPGYHWYRDDDGNYVRVADGSHVIEEVYGP